MLLFPAREPHSERWFRHRDAASTDPTDNRVKQTGSPGEEHAQTDALYRQEAQRLPH